MRLNWRKSVIGLAALAGIILLLNVVFFNAMPKPKRVIEPIQIEHGVSDPAFVRSASALLGSPVLEGNQVEVLRNGPDIYAAKIAAIESAERSVSLETYEFWGEEAAGAMTDALVAAAERGVKVRALPDYIGSVPASGEKFERLNEAGVDVIRWRQPSWYDFSRFNHRTHRKLLIVDGTTGFIGGANIADNWLPDDDGDAYRDNHFRVTGPVVASLQAAFMETWLDARGELLAGDAWFPELEPTGEIRAQVIDSAPREGRHRVRMMFLHALAAAEHQVTASTAYFYPDQGFIDALRDAAERGVTVRIMVPGDSIDQGYLRHASVNRWGPMLDAGVELYKYQPSMYHSKLMSIDDAWASIGSANLDNRSFRINSEANLTFYDEAFAVVIRELIEEDLADARHYSLEEWQDRTWRKRVFGIFGMLIGIYL